MKKLHDSHDWRVRKLRTNRFQPRVLDASEISAAIVADNDAEEEEGRHDEDGSDDGEEEEASGDSGSEADDPVGVSADGVPDSAKERVLFVRAINRSSSLVAPSGQRRPIATWFEVVPQDRVTDVLASVWRPDGLQASAAKVYSLVSEQYVGISHAACAAFVAAQQAKQLSSSNAVADKILAPSLPRAVMERWSSDLTFFDGTIPSNDFIGMSSRRARQRASMKPYLLAVGTRCRISFLYSPTVRMHVKSALVNTFLPAFTPDLYKITARRLPTACARVQARRTVRLVHR